MRWFLAILILLALPAFPQNTWYKYPGNPVIDFGEGDGLGFQPCTFEIIYEDGVYRMWFTSWLVHNDLDFKYATSKDGLSWEIAAGKPIKFRNMEERWGNGLGYFDILKIDSTYFMWYNAAIDTSLDYWGLGLAYSYDGFDWIIRPEPVVNPPIGGIPQVAFDGEKYSMIWVGHKAVRPFRFEAYRQTSDDGIHWVNDPEVSCFMHGEAGSWDSHNILTFCINYNGPSFDLWYGGEDLVNRHIGYASSTDGIHWIRDPDNPVIKTGPLGTWDGGQFGDVVVLKQDSIYKMWYHASDNSRNGIGYATTSVREVREWEASGLKGPKRIIDVRVFKNVETIHVDSLEDLLPQLSGKRLVDALNRLALAYSLNDEDKSFSYADSALLLAKQINYPEGKAMALYSKGNCQYVMDNYSNALVSQLSALQIFDSLGNRQEKGYLLSRIASIQGYTGSYELAYQYYKRAMEVFEALHDTNSLLQSLDELGHAYMQNGDTLEAEKIFRRRLQMLRDKNEVREQAYACEAMGLCYTGRAIDSAINYFDQAENLWRTLGTEFVGTAGFGRIYLLKAEAYHAAAPEYFEKTRAFYQKCHDFSWLGSNQLMVRLLYGMADLYYNVGKYDSAFLRLDGAYYLCSNYLDKISHHFYENLNEKMEDEIYLKSYMEKIYRLYYNLYTVLDNKDKAFEYYKKATQWSDSIFNQQNSRQWAMLQGQYETDRAQNRISVLEKDNEMKSMAVRQSRIYLVVLGVIAFLILLIGLLFIRQNRMQTQHRTLILEQKLMRVQMNPHFIFNSLADLQGFIWSKDPATSNEYLSSFSKLLRLILENSRQEFVPVEKEVSAFTNYLKLQSFRYKNKFEYHIEIDDKIDDEGMLIPPMLTQPFIENSIEHGILSKEGKGHIEIKMKLAEDVIQVDIRDDGIGFQASSEAKQEKKKEHHSLAMKITKERLAMVCKKYRQKMRFEAGNILDTNNDIKGAKISFDVPFMRI